MQLKLTLLAAIVLNFNIICSEIHTICKNYRAPLEIAQNQLVFTHYDSLSTKYITKDFWVSSIAKKVEKYNGLHNYSEVIEEADPNFKNNIYDILNFKS